MAIFYKSSNRGIFCDKALTFFKICDIYYIDFFSAINLVFLEDAHGSGKVANDGRD